MQNLTGNFWEEESWKIINDMIDKTWSLVHTYPKGNSQKMNVMARLEFELDKYNVALMNVCHNSLETLQCYFWIADKLWIVKPVQEELLHQESGKCVNNEDVDKIRSEFDR